MNEKLKITLKGSVNILPLLIPVVPFGIILGAIGIELGFSVLETFATSFIIFGGASQIVFLQLLSGGASQIIAVSSAFVVNSRHFLYGATLSEYLNNNTKPGTIFFGPINTEDTSGLNTFCEKSVLFFSFSSNKSLASDCVLLLNFFPHNEIQTLFEYLPDN